MSRKKSKRHQSHGAASHWRHDSNPFLLDIPVRVKLSQTSKSMKFLVNFRCSQVWEHIKFHQVNSTVHNRLTDFKLSKLLEWVQVRKVTKAIHLTWCKKIQRLGFVPLLSSQVLRVIDLVFTAVNMNSTPVLWTLHSMFPFQLYFVCVVGRASWALEFTRNLHQARLEQAKHHASTRSLGGCAACRHFVMDHAKQVMPGFHGCPLMQCVDCKKAFYCRMDCPVDVREFCECGTVGCHECDSISQCIVCLQKESLYSL